VKVFISWSGEPSQSIACALHGWLPLVVQHVEPWMSNEEIESGMRWNDEIAEALDRTDFGIVCVTASNQHKPWLMFEAGALAKRLQIGRVVPLCIDLAPAEVTGPLAAFQGRRLDKSGMGKLVQDIMTAGQKSFPSESLAELFDAMWKKLELKVDETRRRIPSPQTPQRTAQEMLEELVERVRRLDRGYPTTVSGVATNVASLLSSWGLSDLSEDDVRTLITSLWYRRITAQRKTGETLRSPSDERVDRPTTNVLRNLERLLLRPPEREAELREPGDDSDEAPS